MVEEGGCCALVDLDLAGRESVLARSEAFSKRALRIALLSAFDYLRTAGGCCY